MNIIVCKNSSYLLLNFVLCCDACKGLYGVSRIWVICFVYDKKLKTSKDDTLIFYQGEKNCLPIPAVSCIYIFAVFEVLRLLSFPCRLECLTEPNPIGVFRVLYDVTITSGEKLTNVFSFPLIPPPAHLYFRLIELHIFLMSESEVGFFMNSC